MTPRRRCPARLRANTPFHFHGREGLSQSSMKRSTRHILNGFNWVHLLQRGLEEPLVSSVNNHRDFAKVSPGCAWLQLQPPLCFHPGALRRDHLAWWHLQRQSPASCHSGTFRKCLTYGRKGKETCCSLPSIAAQLGCDETGLWLLRWTRLTLILLISPNFARFPLPCRSWGEESTQVFSL